MNSNELDLEQLDQLAREFWHDDLAKFFPKQKEPAYTEYRMFQAGYQKAQEVYKVKELETENARLREALEEIVNKGPASPGDKKHEIARAALEEK